MRGSEPEYAYSCTGPTGEAVQRARSALDYRDLQEPSGGGRPPGHALSTSTLRRAHRQLRMLRPQVEITSPWLS